MDWILIHRFMENVLLPRNCTMHIFLKATVTSNKNQFTISRLVYQSIGQSLWRHCWYKYDVIVGIGITSLPVNAQSFGSQDCLQASRWFFIKKVTKLLVYWADLMQVSVLVLPLPVLWTLLWGCQLLGGPEPGIRRLLGQLKISVKPPQVFSLIQYLSIFSSWPLGLPKISGATKLKLYSILWTN